jgi:hypothetical protein
MICEGNVHSLLNKLQEVMKEINSIGIVFCLTETGKKGHGTAMPFYVSLVWKNRKV